MNLFDPGDFVVGHNEQIGMVRRQSPLEIWFGELGNGGLPITRLVSENVINIRDARRVSYDLGSEICINREQHFDIGDFVVTYDYKIGIVKNSRNGKIEIWLGQKSEKGLPVTKEIGRNCCINIRDARSIK